MILTYMVLAVALCLSAVAAFYSILGLIAIFAAAVVPVAIMGTILEIAKLVATVWVHDYWRQCRLIMKLYLVPAIAMLMLITSMGIFGFLSKAHTDQHMVSGDVLAKIAIYDEKIKIERENIESARRTIKQLDEAVDQIMGRSNDERGAERSVQVRRNQQAERLRLLRGIEQSQKKITELNEERAPIGAQLRKVEAEVGPIKYIAALIYGDKLEAGLLERAVRWVIIILVIVFDPLAIMMLLAFTESRKWELEIRNSKKLQDADQSHIPTAGAVKKDNISVTPVAAAQPVQPTPSTIYQHVPAPIYPRTDEEFEKFQDAKAQTTPLATGSDADLSPNKVAKRAWKVENPNDTIHRHEGLLEQGKISKLPWQAQIDGIMSARDDDAKNFNNVDFGIKFPSDPIKGDAYIRVDYLPTKLFKWNGHKWIEIDKNITDSFTYNDGYIDHLITKIGSGEYDPDLLNENEKQQIEQRLRQTGQDNNV